MKILVIEDQPTQLKLAHHVLSSAGHNVTDAEAAEQAFAAIKRDRPELILLDLLLPDIDGLTLVRREFPTAIGPVDMLCRDHEGATVAVEIKRRGEIDGVEQLTRYLELLNRDPLLSPVRGIFAAQEIKPQARVLAADRGIECLVLDYDALRGLDDSESRLF